MIKGNLSRDRIEKHTREGTWLGLTLSALVDRAAQTFADKVFMTDSRRKVTYKEFDIITRRLALGLHRIGVKKGDLVGVQLPDRIEYMAMVVAAARIGALYVPFNHQFREVDLVPLLEFCKPILMTVPLKFRNFDYLLLYRDLRSRFSWLKYVLVSDGVSKTDEDGMVSIERMIETPLEEENSDGYLEKLMPDPNDLCFVLLTSGTTAIPKGVMHTHNTWICGCLNQWAQLAIRPDDVLLNLYPMFGTSAQVHMTAILYHRASVVTMDRFSGEEALKLVAKERVTIIGGVAAHLIDMLNAPNFSKYDLSSLRLVYSVGGPVTSALARQVEERMSCRISLLWGSSEATGHTQTLLTDPDEIRLSTVGRPVPYMEVKAIDVEGKEVPPGEVGELLIRGPNNFVGYYNNPRLNEETIDKDGWFRTGDMGIFDQGGSLRIVGRVKDMILRGGENIYSREIEELLAKHPKVKDIAIVGAPNERLGEIVCACVIPKEGEIVTFDEVVSFLKGKIEIHKIPERVEVMDRFPMTDAGKVIKAKLREIIADKVRRKRRE